MSLFKKFLKWGGGAKPNKAAPPAAKPKPKVYPVPVYYTCPAHGCRVVFSGRPKLCALHGVAIRPRLGRRLRDVVRAAWNGQAPLSAAEAVEREAIADLNAFLRAGRS